MRRREFITLLGSAAAWPLAARAQQPATPVIGWLSIVSADATPALPFFLRGLAELGYIENRNVVVKYRWADFHPERLPALAADLVQSQVSLISAGCRRCSPPRLQPPLFPSYSWCPLIRCSLVWSPTSTGRAATSPASRP